MLGMMNTSYAIDCDLAVTAANARDALAGTVGTLLAGGVAPFMGSRGGEAPGVNSALARPRTCARPTAHLRPDLG
ncbi:hypothetical protein [Georgenia sp. Z1491]|uniref:hypothetical protein n=1 Tax=Georgenia sp. Z1491 TaxID=3416707 RepID=UPI003CF2F53F